jgi:hypothetical protein
MLKKFPFNKKYVTHQPVNMYKSRYYFKAVQNDTERKRSKERETVQRRMQYSEEMKRNYRPQIDYEKVKEMEELKKNHPHKNCVIENIYSFHKKNYSIGDNKVFKADVKC